MPISFEIIKIIIQFILLVVAGGAITRYFTKIQRDREEKMALLKDFSTIHGKFIALRYRYNSIHRFWNQHKDQNSHPLNVNDIEPQRWVMFEEACYLIREFQGIKPILFAYFPSEREKYNNLHQTYQQWRRRIIKNKPILQNLDGSNEKEFSKLKDLYLWTATNMKNKILKQN